MKQAFFTALIVLTSMGISNTAFAHSSLAHSPILHSVIHVVASVSVMLVLLIAGIFVSKHLPQSIKQRIKK